MRRADIDQEIYAALAEANIRQYQIARNQNPAMLYILAGDKRTEHRIGTRDMTRRALDELKEEIRVLGIRAERFRKDKRERLGDCGV